MKWIEWIFSGVGTWLLSVFGKKISQEKDNNQGKKRTKFKQIQKGNDYSEFEQTYFVDSNSSSEHKDEEDTIVVQKQVAGNNSKLKQIGGIKHGN